MTPFDPSTPIPDPRPSPFGAARRGRRGLILLIGGFALTAIITVALLRRAPAPSSAPSEADTAGSAEMPVQLSDRNETRIGITFAPAIWGPLGREVRAVAQVNFAEPRVRSVALLTEGWVDQLYVDFTGQSVRRGDPLFSIYAPMIVAAEEELLLAKGLAGDVAGGTPEAAKSAADLVVAARRRLRYWGVPQDEIDRLETSGEVHRTVTFRSPFTGVVIDKAVVAGQRLMPGDVAYRIADLDVVWLEGEVFEQDLPGVHLGLAITAEFTALPGDIRRGRVTYIYPTVDPQTRTARIRVEMANPGLALKPGMYGTIRFTTPGRPTLTVPRSAVLSTGERSLVFVRGADGSLTPRTVTVGSASEQRVEILSGLVRGDTVVASGTFLLDAESNLGSLLGGMGNMPGMDVKAPTTRPSTSPAAPTDSMPGMDMTKPTPTPTPAAPSPTDHSKMKTTP
ncbi:MAG: efflux RND transporter periplasmic adaptor subunit [Gemmatimonadales bacterium]